MRWHEPTRAYVDRRRQQGLSTKEIMRCLKRLIARQIYYVIRRLELVKPVPAAT
jgi:transposase